MGKPWREATGVKKSRLMRDAMCATNNNDTRPQKTYWCPDDAPRPPTPSVAQQGLVFVLLALSLALVQPLLALPFSSFKMRIIAL